MPDQLMTTAEAAEYLRVKPATLASLLREGRRLGVDYAPTIGRGKARRWRADKLLPWYGAVYDARAAAKGGTVVGEHPTGPRPTARRRRKATSQDQTLQTRQRGPLTLLGGR